MSKLTLAFSVRTRFLSNRNKLISISSRWYSKNEDESNKLGATKEQNQDADQPATDDKSKARLTRLNSLLKEMMSAPKVETKPPLELARPSQAKWGKSRKTVQRVENKTKTPENKIPFEPLKTKEPEIVTAAKEVAETLGGNTKQTESELLRKLLGSYEDEKSDAITSLSDIFKGMKIDMGTPKVQQKSRSEQVRELYQKSSRQQERRQDKAKFRPVGPMRKQQITKLDIIELYGSKPLGIFTSDPKEYTEHVKNTTWEELSKREMKLLITHPPSNHFQQMILWTEQGKLWKFPIDNEQGLEDENNISFAEHIFLDRHLDEWCPPKGPVRHFMELVCIGLSKNPYLTVNAKIEHIEWYRNYFEEKRQLLKEVGAALNEYEPIKEIDTK